MMHSGQTHSHLQSKQKYRISSSGCSPQTFLLEMPESSTEEEAAGAGE